MPTSVEVSHNGRLPTSISDIKEGSTHSWSAVDKQPVELESLTLKIVSLKYCVAEFTASLLEP